MTGNVHKYTKCSQETYTHVQTIVGKCKGGDTWHVPPPPIQDIVYSALTLPSTSISGGSRGGGSVGSMEPLQCITLVHIHRAIPHLQELRSYSITDLSRAHYQYALEEVFARSAAYSLAQILHASAGGNYTLFISDRTSYVIYIYSWL